MLERIRIQGFKSLRDAKVEGPRQRLGKRSFKQLYALHDRESLTYLSSIKALDIIIR
jgi:AAA15 family ATPase/GTPase